MAYTLHISIKLGGEKMYPQICCKWKIPVEISFIFVLYKDQEKDELMLV